MALGTSSPTRTIDRIRALSKADLPAEQIVTLQVCAIGRALGTSNRPAFLVLESRDVPQHEFAVWLGSETITGELRMLLAAGIWPGPAEVPSPSMIIRDPKVDRFVSVTLWGEGAEGPWSPLWRERLIRHGLYGAFVSPKGRIGVMLTHRGGDEPAFTPGDVAFMKACSPYVEHALDRADGHVEDFGVAVETVHVGFSPEGKIAALSVFGAEILRDLGGGGPGAGDRGRQIVEAAVVSERSTPHLNPRERAELTLAGGEEERAFREARADIVIGLARSHSARRTMPVVLGQNALGRYELWPTVLVGYSGELQLVASLTRFLTPFAMRLRGAVQVDATGREIQLLCGLVSGGTLKVAADQMGVAEGTAKTLGKRLAQRVDESGLGATAHRLEALGRANWP